MPAIDASQKAPSAGRGDPFNPLISPENLFHSALDGGADPRQSPEPRERRRWQAIASPPGHRFCGTKSADRRPRTQPRGTVSRRSGGSRRAENFGFCGHDASPLGFLCSAVWRNRWKRRTPRKPSQRFRSATAPCRSNRPIPTGVREADRNRESDQEKPCRDRAIRLADPTLPMTLRCPRKTLAFLTGDSCRSLTLRQNRHRGPIQTPGAWSRCIRHH